MNKVQSAISQLLATTGVGVSLVKGYQKELANTQEQENIAKAQEEHKTSEAMDVAKRVAMTRLGIGEKSQEAYLLAEKMGTLNPRIRMRGEKGNLMFTAGTTARRMADMSLAGETYSKALVDASYRERLLSMGKNTQERVKNTIIAEKGGRI